VCGRVGSCRHKEEVVQRNLTAFSFFKFAGTMPTPDVKNYADKVGLTLSLRDGRLIGEALAFNTQDFDPYAGKPEFTVSSYVELTKTSPLK
jgi:hypothetical protein